MIEQQIIDLNKKIIQEKLVVLTWGNASIYDRENGLVYIKPSGVDVHDMKPNDVAVVDLDNKHITGKKPSVDTPTHIELYKKFSISCIIHTHSLYGTVFAQAKRSIPCLGTTHADYFFGDIPVVDDLTLQNIDNDYEKNTGLSIVDYLCWCSIKWSRQKRA